MRMQVRVNEARGGRAPREVVADVIHLGRDASCEVATDPFAFPTVSAVHARIEPASGGFVVTNLSRNGKTLVNDRPLDGSGPLRGGDRVRLGVTGPTVEILALEADAGPAPASSPRRSSPSRPTWTCCGARRTPIGSRSAAAG